MSKFKVRLKITGFELEIEGNREDVSLVSQGVAAQFGGMLQPAAEIVEGDVAAKSAPLPSPMLVDGGKKTSRRRRSASTPASAGPSPSDAIEFRHDPEKYGNPQQSWNTASKGMWLLYVCRELASVKQMTAGQIARTFEKHFRQSGAIKGNNVSRDLGKAKQERPPLVGEDTTGEAGQYYLTDEGNRRAQALIAEALTPPQPNGAG
jgi:hypothetical protein